MLQCKPFFKGAKAGWLISNTLWHMPCTYTCWGNKTLVVYTLTISISFHYENPTHPSSRGKLCMWTVFVLRIVFFTGACVEWFKSSYGEVMTTYHHLSGFVL